MPEGTVIGDPAWWAPRLWRFARYAFEQGQGDAYKPECAPAKATRAQTGQLSPAVQSPSETTAEHICGTPDAMCDMDCVERAYRPPPVLTIKFRPLLVSGSYGESPNGPVILIDSEQPPEQQLTAMWHEVLHLVLAALGRAHDENWIETMALRIAAACPDLLTQPRATEKATEQSSAPANQLALEPVPPAGSVAGADPSVRKPRILKFGTLTESGGTLVFRGFDFDLGGKLDFVGMVDLVIERLQRAASDLRSSCSSVTISPPAVTSPTSKEPDSLSGQTAWGESRCEKHGVELAFPGDECWACEQENKP